MLLKHNYLKSLFIYLITYLPFTILQSALFKGVKSGIIRFTLQQVVLTPHVP